jgi:hypothetical protein
MIDTKPYIIAIPSYKRSDIIQKKTLHLLQKHNISISRIYIFVANQDEYNIYKNNIQSNLYNSLIVGKLGLKDQRNFISHYFPINTCIVQMDDDLDDIVELHQKNISSIKKKYTSKNLKKIINYTQTINNLDQFIQDAFKLCKEKKAFLWGVYPLANAYFMTPTISKELNFIVGPFWGCINRHDSDLQLSISEKENSERTLQYCTKDQIVIRFNNIGVSTKYYKNQGGMQAESKDRKQEALKSVNYLHKLYPKLTKITYRKNGFPEIKLKKLLM